MTEFLFLYGLFFAKVITGLIALVFVVAIISAAQKKEDSNGLQIICLNDKYRRIKDRLLQALLDEKEFKAHTKKSAKEDKQKNKLSKSKPADDDEQPSRRARLFVLEFEGDVQASEVETMREEITAVLSVAEPVDQVLLKLDNSGGIVHEHGLAASQLQRLVDKGIPLTVSVDRVAASGGYMMACVANRIIAAPFAVIGSIGVLAQLPNFNRLLDRVGVDFEQHTAGEYKRTVTMFGKNGKKERDKLKLDLQETHVLFQDFVTQMRPELDIAKIATGEHWYGAKAKELKLVDELITSDQYLTNALADFDIYAVTIEEKKDLSERLFGGLLSAVQNLQGRLSNAQNNSRYH